MAPAPKANSPFAVILYGNVVSGSTQRSTVSGPLALDVWVDPETTLPHRITANGEFAFGADSMVFDATMRFFGYNEPVEIPGAPPDAVPFALLGGP